MKYENKVKLAGTVTETRIRRNNVTYTLVLDAGNVKVYPEVTQYFGNDTPSFFMPGDRVYTESHMEMQRLMDHNTQEYVYQRTLVLDWIEMQKRILLEDTDADSDLEIPEAGGLGDDVNRTIHTGLVSRVYDADRNRVVLTMTVERDADDGKGTRTDSCNITCYQRQADIARTLQPGDAVTAAGVIRMAPPGSKNKWFVSCKDIAKVEQD